MASCTVRYLLLRCHISYDWLCHTLQSTVARSTLQERGTCKSTCQNPNPQGQNHPAYELQARNGGWHNPAVTILQELEIAEKEGRKLRRDGESKKERVKEEEEARPSGTLDSDGPTPMDTQTSGLDERSDALGLSLLPSTSWST